ncbi:unnamed protein product, partial [Didymodactylos carnosus]
PPPLSERVQAMAPLLSSQSRLPIPPAGLPGAGIPGIGIPGIGSPRPIIPYPLPGAIPSLYPQLNGMDLPGSSPALPTYASSVAPLTKAGFASYFRRAAGLAPDVNGNDSDDQSRPGSPYVKGGYGLATPYANGNIREGGALIDMIRRHFLQQQRLNYNHERILEQYQQVRAPLPSEFRMYGSSTLPGRDYDRWLQDAGRSSRNSSRISSEGARYLGAPGQPAWLNYPANGGQIGSDYSRPGEYTRNISSVMQNRAQYPESVSSYQPIDFQNHPVFGPTPAHIKPLFGQKKLSADDNDQKDAQVSDRNNPPPGARNNLISYPAWKEKYQDVIPVNSFLYNVRAQRPNNTNTLFDESRLPAPGAVMDERRNVSPISFDSTTTDQSYDRLQQSNAANTRVKNDDRPDMPYRLDTFESIHSAPNRINSFPSAPKSTTLDSPLSPLSSSLIPPAPLSPTTLQTNPPTSTEGNFPISSVRSTESSVSSNLPSLSSPIIPPAPPLPSSTYQTPSTNAISYAQPYQTPSTTYSGTNAIPSTQPYQTPTTTYSGTNAISSTQAYQTPSTTFSGTNAVPSTQAYQTPSTTFSETNAIPSTNYQTLSSLPPAKSVSFGAQSNAVPDISSSSTDSDDEDNIKRKRRKKRFVICSI